LASSLACRADTSFSWRSMKGGDAVAKKKATKKKKK